MDIHNLNRYIQPVNMEICRQAREKWDNSAKPLGSLGILEDMVVRLAGIQNTVNPSADKKTAVVFCSDNGVVSEGVTQCGNDVTAKVTENFIKGTAAINAFARVCGADVMPVDIGICRDMNCDGIMNCKIAYGTRNIAEEPAMTYKECEKAILAGINIVKHLKEQGCNIIMTGEMGIGNTTTSSAVLSVLENIPPEKVTGKGAGLSASAFEHKIDVIKKAVSINNPDRNNIIDVMSKLGGFDICAMAGCFIGGAVYRIPVLIDGFISAVSALCAVRLADKCREYMFATHCSAEPAGKYVLDALDMKAPLDCNMKLGEGTGAVIGAKLFDFALSAYNEISSFEESSIEKYQHY